MSSEAVIARRYARALHELIRDEGAGSLRAPLHRLAEAASHPEVAPLLRDPALPAAAKRGVLEALVKRMPKELRRLIALLAGRDKLALLPEIDRQLSEMIQRDADTVEVELIAATRLPASLRERIAAALEPVVGRKLKISVRQDERIIGGFIVNIGDRRIDHSIRTRLHGMRAALAG